MFDYKQIIGDLKHIRDYSEFAIYLNVSIDKAIEMIELLNLAQTQEDIQLGQAVRLAFKDERYIVKVINQKGAWGVVETLENEEKLLQWYVEQQEGKVE